MASQNIEIGIDLGTTNSEVAVNQKGNTEVIKNIWQDEYTPSVFGFDKAGNKVIGKKAYEKLFKDGTPEEEKNYVPEIKRLMGTPEKVSLPNGNIEMSAEEISAEILRCLREDVQRKYPDVSLLSAVITVPAYFSILQKEATQRAGNLAGFEHVVLLQEPISAAMAYGFSNKKDEDILVYDLGGGTFDVAVISSKDGVLSVINQCGDNFLGGKDIDDSIVDKIIAPAIKDKYPELKDLKRINKKYKAVYARLKYAAEKAKIELSQLEKTSVDIDITNKAIAAKDNNIFVNFNFSRKQLDAIIASAIKKTISLAKEAIAGSGIKKESIERIVLVGGSTQIPLIKRMLTQNLDISVDASSDPLTAVARGAAVFALGQKVPQDVLDKAKPKDASSISLELNYDGLTADEEQLITGTCSLDNSEGWFLQIQSESGYFNSPKIPVKNGKIKTTIDIEPNKNNLYWIYLFDPSGKQVPVSPESFSITHGLTVGKAQLSHSIGVALRSGLDGKAEEMDFFFEKGDRIPLEKKRTYHTAQRLKMGDILSPLYIPILEGESKKPENNTFIADTAINGKELPHDIPEGADIDITIRIDESNVLTTDWFLPIISMGGNLRATIRDQAVSAQEIREAFSAQSERASAITKNCSEAEKEGIEERLAEISNSINQADGNEDQKRKANKDLKELGQKLDDLEETKQLPQLESAFRDAIKEAKEIIDKLGLEENKDSDQGQLECLITQGEEAIKKNERSLLSRTIDEISDLSSSVFWANPQAWLHQFSELKSGTYSFSDEEEAKYYFDKGERAIQNGDLDELKGCVVGLAGLLPHDQADKLERKISGVMR